MLSEYVAHNGHRIIFEERILHGPITAFANLIKIYARSGAPVPAFSKAQGRPFGAARGHAHAEPLQFTCPACLKTAPDDAYASMIMIYMSKKWIFCGDCSLYLRIGGRRGDRIADRAARNVDQNLV